MKKLIVFSVIFALVAGSVFAADVSATVLGNADLLKGNDQQEVKEIKKDDGSFVYGNANKNGDSFAIGRINLEGSGALEDGTIGGWARLRTGSQGDGVKAWGKVWWKPVDAFKLQIGANPDGEFGLEGVAGWGFYQLAGDVGIINNGNTWGWSYTGFGPGDDPTTPKFRNAFYGGWDSNAVIFTIAPVEALEVNLAIPLTSQSAAYKDYLKFTAQVKYNIDGVGTAGITYQNGLGYSKGSTVYNFVPKSDPTDDQETPYQDSMGGDVIIPGDPGVPVPYLKAVTDKDKNDPSKLFVYFGLSSIENLGIDVGFGVTFPSNVIVTETAATASIPKTEKTVTINHPLSAGLGVNFSSGALGIKARVLGEFLGSTDTETVIYKADGTTKDKTVTDNPKGDGFTMLIDVQPSFAVNDNMTAYLSLGTGFKTGWDVKDKVEDGKTIYKKETRSLFAWHVQPYVVITPSYWSGAFFAGFRLDSPIDRYVVEDGKEHKPVDTRTLNWSIPIGITFSF